jgi:hypothetical protein
MFRVGLGDRGKTLVIKVQSVKFGARGFCGSWVKDT